MKRQELKLTHPSNGEPTPKPPELPWFLSFPTDSPKPPPPPHFYCLTTLLLTPSLLSFPTPSSLTSPSDVLTLQKPLPTDFPSVLHLSISGNTSFSGFTQADTQHRLTTIPPLPSSLFAQQLLIFHLLVPSNLQYPLMMTPLINW